MAILWLFNRFFRNKILSCYLIKPSNLFSTLYVNIVSYFRLYRMCFSIDIHVAVIHSSLRFKWGFFLIDNWKTHTVEKYYWHSGMKAFKSYLFIRYKISVFSERKLWLKFFSYQKKDTRKSKIFGSYSGNALTTHIEFFENSVFRSV